MLIQATDGSGRGKSKLSTPHFGKYIGWLTADELGQAFGRQTVIHAALAESGLHHMLTADGMEEAFVRAIEHGLKTAGLIPEVTIDDFMETNVGGDVKTDNRLATNQEVGNPPHLGTLCE